MYWGVEALFQHHDSFSFVQQTRSSTVTACCDAANLQDMASDVQAHKQSKPNTTHMHPDSKHQAVVSVAVSDDHSLEGSQHGHQQGWVAKDIHHQAMLAVGGQHTEQGQKHFQEPEVLLQNKYMCLLAFLCRLRNTLLF